MIKVKLYMCGGEKPVSQYPMGLAYLMSNCRTNDIHIKTVSTSKELVDCDYIGLSATASATQEAVDIVRGTKIPVIIGGQATLWDGLQDYPFKHIVIGEGESALSTILNSPDTAPRIIRNMFVKDVDSIKFPDLGKCGWIPVMTARGCPFTCNFCSSHKYWNDVVRMHSPEYIINAVLDSLKLNPRGNGIVGGVYIMDDLFAITEKRLASIHELWMKKGMHKKIFMMKGFVKSSSFTEKMAIMMKEMRFVEARFGAESGSDAVLKILGKRATVEDHQRTIDIGQKVGLPISASFMHSIPGETEEDKRLTGEFIRKNKGKFTMKGNYHFKPFPGTDMYKGVSPLDLNMKVR